MNKVAGHQLLICKRQHTSSLRSIRLVPPGQRPQLEVFLGRYLARLRYLRFFKRCKKIFCCEVSSFPHPLPPSPPKKETHRKKKKRSGDHHDLCWGGGLLWRGDGDEKMFPFRPQRDCCKPRRKKTQTFETKVLAVGGLATIISKMVNLLDDDTPSLTI